MATYVSNGSYSAAFNDADTVYVAGHVYSVTHCLSQFAAAGDVITMPSGSFNWSGNTLTISKISRCSATTAPRASSPPPSVPAP